jgi:hypothetical protein
VYQHGDGVAEIEGEEKHEEGEEKHEEGEEKHEEGEEEGEEGQALVATQHRMY